LYGSTSSGYKVLGRWSAEVAGTRSVQGDFTKDAGATLQAAHAITQPKASTAIPDVSDARYPITKLITSGFVQPFPLRPTLSEASRITPSLDLSGRKRRKQGFDSPRLQMTDHESLT
jgi:hypothetical protein